MGRHVVGAAVVAAVAAGSAFGSGQVAGGAAVAGSDQAVVRELRAVRKELRTLNANVGRRDGAATALRSLDGIREFACREQAQTLSERLACSD